METRSELGAFGDGSDRQPLVLLAEDDESNILVAQGALALFKCKVVTVRDGAAAVKVAGEHHFDLVLMDCHMPLMNGLQATQQIREHDARHHRPRVPIVGLTGSAMYSERQACLAAGMDFVMTKPFHFKQLREVLERWASLDSMPE
jgi:CheY-like chemotaxis protein